jgi:SSS family solute:Na+ symporter
MPMDSLVATLNADGKIDVNQLVPSVLIHTLPSWFLAIVLLLVLSASMSTLCSLALTSASAFSIDVFRGYMAPRASEKTASAPGAYREAPSAVVTHWRSVR